MHLSMLVTEIIPQSTIVEDYVALQNCENYSRKLFFARLG